ncbi:MAG: hypothetical protein GY765_33930 [bacterium]|nr:hypothetical protein [bacterium]
MSVNISGPVKGNNSGTYTWCANVSNGTASSYFWQYRYSTSESYRTWGSTQCMSAHLPLDRDLLLKVTVTDAAGNQATDTFFTMNLDTFKPSIIRPNYDSMESIAGDVSYILSAAASKNLVGPNPYDYINNERFRAIVAKGPKALISIRQMILESNENGLENYILAIAAEEIARVNLKDTSFKWATGQEFATQWDSFMRKLPTLVEEIVTSNLPQANKHKALLKLGIPAVPYILTEIERGEKGFDKVLKALLKGAPGMIERTEGESLESWKKNNKDTISFLIEMADAYRNQ